MRAAVADGALVLIWSGKFDCFDAVQAAKEVIHFPTEFPLGHCLRWEQPLHGIHHDADPGGTAFIFWNEVRSRCLLATFGAKRTDCSMA